MKIYLQGLNTDDIKTISYDDKKTLFERITNDYKNGEISLDELSSLSETLWWSLGEKEKTSDFGNVLNAGMELSFYERNIDEENSEKTFVWFLKKILSFKKD